MNGFVIEFDHVQLAAPPGCEAEARRFFGELLGLTELEKPSGLSNRGGCWFQVGARQLHIGVEEPFQPARKAHPAFRVIEIDRLAAKLEASGVTCKWDYELPTVRRFFADDPWGNRLEFVQPVA